MNMLGRLSLLTLWVVIAITFCLIAPQTGFGQEHRGTGTFGASFQDKTLTGFRNESAWRLTPRREIHGAVVRISWAEGIGSGCVIKHDGEGVVAVTNHHVISHWDGSRFTNPTDKATITGGGGSAEGDVIYANPDQDIAIVYAKHATARVAAEIYTGDLPPIGTDIEFCGYGGPVRKLRTFVGRRVRTDYAVSIDAAVVSGDSGGPMLYGDALCGVNFGAPGKPASGGRVEGWALNKPASSNVSGREVAEVLTQLGFRPRCRPGAPCPPVLVPVQPAAPQPKCQDQCPANCQANCRCGCDTQGGPGAADPPLRGEAGPPGKDGIDGKDGTDGKDAVLTSEHLQQIANMVTNNIRLDPAFRGPAGPPGKDGGAGEYPPRRVLIVNGKTGIVHDDDTYPPGEPIVLDVQAIVNAR